MKVVSGVQEGATGMVVKVDGHVLIIASDTTKEDVCLFDISKSSFRLFYPPIDLFFCSTRYVFLQITLL